MKNFTFLVLDDDRTARLIVQEHIKKAGLACKRDVVILQADSPDDAWNLFKTNKVHCILTDVYLGGPISGVDFLIAVKKETGHRHFPCAILTGMSDDFNVDRLWDSGWVISKPMPKWFWKICTQFIVNAEAFWFGVESKTEEELLKEHIWISPKDKEGLP